MTASDPPSVGARRGTEVSSLKINQPGSILTLIHGTWARNRSGLNWSQPSERLYRSRWKFTIHNGLAGIE